MLEERKRNKIIAITMIPIQAKTIVVMMKVTVAEMTVGVTVIQEEMTVAIQEEMTVAEKEKGITKI